MVSKRRRWVRGSQEKSEQREYLPVRSRLMGERSGLANSAQSQMCGRGGVAGVATMTSRQGCVESTDRQLPQGPENGQQALRLQAGKEDRRKSKSLEDLRVRIEVLEKNEGMELKEGKASHPGEKATLAEGVARS